MKVQTMVFSAKFLLEAQEEPEEDSNSCTKFDPEAIKCLFCQGKMSRVKD